MNCKVIVTCFNEGRRIDHNKAFPDHNQNIDGGEDVLRMITKIVEIEQENDPGVPMDLLIINNHSIFQKGYDYLHSIDGTELKRGKVIILNRENVGGSFGGYNHAYQMTEYEHYLFTEDDIIIGGDNYYKKILEKYTNGNYGFLGLIGLGSRHGRFHAHGGVGMTSRVALKNVHGEKLPYHSGGWEKSYVIEEGEIPFSAKFREEGYELGVYGDGETWDYKNNLCIPYYNYVY